MLSRIRKKLNPDLKTLNTITISKAAILHNLRTLREIQPKSAFFPVLKSNAYGHGILPLLEILKGQEFPYLAVDSFPEYQLIHKHSRFQILIMGTTFPENYSAFDLKRVAFAISNIQSLKAIAQLKRKVRIHLFIDTGMHREGFQTEDLKSALSFLHQHKQIIVEGVMSHLHSADTDDDTMHQQILIFKNLTSCIEQAGFHPTRRHLGASAGLLKIQDPYFNAFRPGIVLYGYSPFPQPNLDLHPALSLHSTIVALQKVKAGEGVSYNHTWKADKDCIVATIPFGYYEGWMRTASRKLIYRYQGKICPQLGTLCMNLSSCIADDTMHIGDPIELISNETTAPNSVEKIAQQAETIPYEILIRLDKGIRRRVV